MNYYGSSKETLKVELVERLKKRKGQYFCCSFKFESNIFPKCYYCYDLLDVRQEAIVKSH